jgi:succinate-semialdehyde dehydrogenase/glutarate-semialdehyde dehydrogenase
VSRSRRTRSGRPKRRKNVVGKVHRDYLARRRTGFDRRASLMRNAANILNRNARDYARLMAEEMGKPLLDGVVEVKNIKIVIVV